MCGARVGSGVRECARARARRRGPLASNSLRREFEPFEGNSGILFEGDSKGTRRVLEVLRVVSGTSCNHHLLGQQRRGCAEMGFYTEQRIQASLGHCQLYSCYPHVCGKKIQGPTLAYLRGRRLGAQCIFCCGLR